MAKLKAKKRNALPSSAFGLPRQRKYPEEDPAHAANAESRATQMVKKGKLTPEQAAQIRAKARRVLGR